MKKSILLLTVMVALGTGATAFAAENDSLTVNGDIRLRFDKQTNYNQPDFNANKYRIRLNLGYKLSPEWSFNTRVVAGDSLFGDAPPNVDDVQISVASLTYKQPDWNATIGRQVFSMFEGLAVSMDDGHTPGDAGYPAAGNRPDGGQSKNFPSLQGVKFQNKIGKTNVTSFYGNLNARTDDGANYNVKGIAAIGPVGAFKVGGMVYTTDSYVSAADVSKYGMKNGSKTGYSVTANTKLFNNYLYTGAEYIWGLADTHDKAYKLIVKTPETKKVGDMQYAVEYRNVEQNALDYNSCTNTARGISTMRTKNINIGDFTYWALSAKRQLTPDLSATLFYEKYNPQNHGKTTPSSAQVEDQVYRLQLDYKF